MQFCKLANTDLEVSRVAFGCWAIIGGFNWGPQDEADSIAALRAAHESGITFFDTAEAYGEGYSEQLVCKALADMRDEIVIASKVNAWNFTPDKLKQACERSLRNLGTDRIDLYQLHWPNHKLPIAETMRAMEDLKREGKILHAGVSNFGKPELQELAKTGCKAVTNQLAYNLLFRAIEFEILPQCREMGMHVLCYSPIMQGLLAGKFANADAVPEDRARTRHFASSRAQARHHEDGAEAETFAAIDAIREIAAGTGYSMAEVALGWLLGRDGVACVICGGRNREQAIRNARAADVRLEPEILSSLSAVTEVLKNKLGKNADMWCSGGEARIR